MKQLNSYGQNCLCVSLHVERFNMHFGPELFPFFSAEKCIVKDNCPIILAYSHCQKDKLVDNGIVEVNNFLSVRFFSLKSDELDGFTFVLVSADMFKRIINNSELFESLNISNVIYFDFYNFGSFEFEELIKIPVPSVVATKSVAIMYGFDKHASTDVVNEKEGAKQVCNHFQTKITIPSFVFKLKLTVDDLFSLVCVRNKYREIAVNTIQNDIKMLHRMVDSDVFDISIRLAFESRDCQSFSVESIVNEIQDGIFKMYIDKNNILLYLCVDWKTWLSGRLKTYSLLLKKQEDVRKITNCLLINEFKNYLIERLTPYLAYDN